MDVSKILTERELDNLIITIKSQIRVINVSSNPDHIAFARRKLKAMDERLRDHIKNGRALRLMII